MKKLTLTTLISFLIFSFAFAEPTQVDVNVLRQVIELLQKAIQTGVPLVATPTKPLTPTTPSAIETKAILLPKGVSPAVPLEKPITPEVIRPILPDDDRENDVIVQINNLRITRIATSTPNAKAVFFAVRDTNWGCAMFENDNSLTGTPCIINLRKPIIEKELAIKVAQDTILLQRNRQRAKLEDFQVNDKINVYGFMDKDNYGIEGLIVRKISAKIVPVPLPEPKPILFFQKSTTSLPIPTSSFSDQKICIQVITPAYNPNNPQECKEFPTPCDIPPGWIKTNKCLQ